MHYKKGDILAGKVTGITDYGLFVKLDENSSGLVHISEISSRYVKNIEQYAKLGEGIRVRGMEVLENNRYRLSIKDIDYRILKMRRSRIKETKSGFSNLALYLNQWIGEALIQKDKNEKKQ